MDIFDTVGTLAGIGELGGFLKAGKLPRAGRAMIADALGTCVGATCGTPTVTSYIESASGISSGGRSGLTSVITGLLFLLAIFFSPLIKMIGGGYQTESGSLLHPVTAPALIIVGSMLDAITTVPLFLENEYLGFFGDWTLWVGFLVAVAASVFTAIYLNCSQKKNQDSITNNAQPDNIK